MPELSQEVQLLLRAANVTPQFAETQLQQRANSQMHEYLRVINCRLDKEYMTSTIDAAHAEQVSELLRCIHAT